MYKKYESLIHDLTKDQSKYEQLRQSEEEEIAQININITKSSSTRDSSIQAETKKVNDAKVQSERNLELKEQINENAKNNRSEQMSHDLEVLVGKLASNVVKKKTDILNEGPIKKLRSEQLKMAKKMKNILSDQGSPTPFSQSKKNYLGEYYKYSKSNMFLDIPKSILFPTLGSLITILYTVLVIIAIAFLLNLIGFDDTYSYSDSELYGGLPFVSYIISLARNINFCFCSVLLCV